MLGDALLGQIIVKIRGGKRGRGAIINDSRHENIVPFSDLRSLSQKYGFLDFTPQKHPSIGIYWS
jgi:hypothetical protein